MCPWCCACLLAAAAALWPHGAYAAALSTVAFLQALYCLPGGCHAARCPLDLPQWGAVERRPRRYDWSGYRQLFALVRALGLKLQVCGASLGGQGQRGWEELGQAWVHSRSAAFEDRIQPDRWCSGLTPPPPH